MSSAVRRRDLRPCTLMMVQNEHWNGQPRPASKLVVWPVTPFDLLAGNDRQRLAFEVRQVAKEIIQRLQLSSDRVLQQALKPTFSFTGEHRHAEVHHLLNAGIALRQHRKGAGHMEATDRDLDSPAAKLFCDIERARKLVGLYADQRHHAGIRRPDRARQILDPHLPVGLVDHFDVDVEIGTENLALATFQRDAIEAGQRIRRQPAAPPSDDVTVIIVMRRLDQNKPETLVRLHKESISVRSILPFQRLHRVTRNSLNANLVSAGAHRPDQGRHPNRKTNLHNN
jgi:hypothetical protein